MAVTATVWSGFLPVIGYASKLPASEKLPKTSMDAARLAGDDTAQVAVEARILCSVNAYV